MMVDAAVRAAHAPLAARVDEVQRRAVELFGGGKGAGGGLDPTLLA
jgi:hypothetical protein